MSCKHFLGHFTIAAHNILGSWESFAHQEHFSLHTHLDSVSRSLSHKHSRWAITMCSDWNSANREDLKKIFSSLIQKNFQITKITLALGTPKSGYYQLKDFYGCQQLAHGSTQCTWWDIGHRYLLKCKRYGETRICLTCSWAPSRNLHPSAHSPKRSGKVLELKGECFKKWYQKTALLSKMTILIVH